MEKSLMLTAGTIVLHGLMDLNPFSSCPSVYIYSVCILGLVDKHSNASSDNAATFCDHLSLAKV